MAHEQCLLQTKRRVWNADVMVVNHAAIHRPVHARSHLFLNMIVVTSTYGRTRGLTDHPSHDLSGQDKDMLGKLFNEKTQKGLLISRAASNRTFQQRQSDAISAVNRVRFKARELFDTIFEAQLNLSAKNGRCRQPLGITNEVSPALKELASRIIQVSDQFESDEERIEY